MTITPVTFWTEWCYCGQIRVFARFFDRVVLLGSFSRLKKGPSGVIAVIFALKKDRVVLLRSFPRLNFACWRRNNHNYKRTYPVLTGNTWAEKITDIVIVFYAANLPLKIILSRFIFDSFSLVPVKFRILGHSTPSQQQPNCSSTLLSCTLQKNYSFWIIYYYCLLIPRAYTQVVAQ